MSVEMASLCLRVSWAVWQAGMFIAGLNILVRFLGREWIRLLNVGGPFLASLLFCGLMFSNYYVAPRRLESTDIMLFAAGFLFFGGVAASSAVGDIRRYGV